MAPFLFPFYIGRPSEQQNKKGPQNHDERYTNNQCSSSAKAATTKNTANDVSPCTVLHFANERVWRFCTNNNIDKAKHISCLAQRTCRLFITYADKHDKRWTPLDTQ